MADSLGQAFVEIEVELDDLKNALSKARRMVGDATDDMANDFDDMADEADSHFGRLGKAVDGLKGPFAAGMAAMGAAALAVGGKSVMMAAKLEQTEKAFGTLLGSGEKAKSFLDDLEQFAASSPFDFDGLEEASKKMLAFGFDAEETKNIMQTLGDATSAMGGGTEELNGMAAALGQMQAKGKASTEELMQLTERGIPAFEIMQEEMGITGEKLEESLRKGAIGGEEAVQALLTGMNKRFDGAMEEQNNTVLGQWNSMKENLGYVLKEIGQTIIDTFNLKGIFEEASKTLEQFKKDLESGGIRQALDNLIPDWLEAAIVAITGAFIGLGVAIAVAVIPIIWSLVAAQLALLAPYVLIGAAVALLAFLFIKYWSQIKEFTLAAVAAVVNFLSTSWTWIKTNTAALWASITAAFQSGWNWLKNLIAFLVTWVVVKWTQLKRSVVLAVVGLIKSIRDKWTAFKTNLQNLSTAIKNSVVNAWQNLKSSIQNIVDSVRTWVVNKWTWLKNKVVGAAENIRDKVENAFRTMKNTVEGVWSGIQSGIRGGINAVIRTINSFIRKVNGLISKANRIPGVNLPELGTIPQLARGGNIIGQGMALVGEAGPELLELPRGARVTPLNGESTDGMGEKVVNFTQNNQAVFTEEQFIRMTQKALKKFAINFNTN